MALSPDLRVQLLRAIANGASIRAATASLGIRRQYVYTLQKKDPNFAAALADAVEFAKPSPIPETPAPRPAGRIRPCDLTPRQRRLVRDFLDAFDAPPTPAEMTPAERTQHALDQWLAHKEWSDDCPPDETILGKLSRRALADWRRHQLLREAERAAGE